MRGQAVSRLAILNASFIELFIGVPSDRDGFGQVSKLSLMMTFIETSSIPLGPLKAMRCCTGVVKSVGRPG